MMLSLSVEVVDSTVMVTSDDGADNVVAIRQTRSNYLIVKEHDKLSKRLIWISSTMAGIFTSISMWATTSCVSTGSGTD